MNLLIAPLIGIASALLTILLAPNLQHYFWTRQRYAERQFAVIEEVNNQAAEVLVVLQHGYPPPPERYERLHIPLLSNWDKAFELVHDGY